MFAFTVINWIEITIQFAGLFAGLFAAVHAARQRPDAFTATDKLNKPAWIAITGVSSFVIYLFGTGNILSFAAIIAIAIYFADVRPKVDDIQRGGGRW